MGANAAPLRSGLGSYRVEVVRILLGDGAGTNLRDRAGRTALDFAERDPLSKLEASRKEAKVAVTQLLRAHGAKKSSELSEGE